MEGFLRKNQIGRWEVVSANGVVELTCGDVFEIETSNGMSSTRMEAWKGEYYAVGGHILNEGLKARAENRHTRFVR